ncbi:MAG: hypothetical protein JSS72_13745 [Armatimonadetes bacterium]|nr:hypothetical protein [Armatimonadota bacterium]
MSAMMHYLTVQDVLWVNLTVTKRVNHFNEARLEEATFYQCAYGDSTGLVPQAGRFMSGFLRMHPIASGNEATAFVSGIAFLRMNGKNIKLSDSDAAQWLAEISAKRKTGRESIEAIVEDFDAGHEPDLRAIVGGVLADFPQTIEHLVSEADSQSVGA